MALKFLPRRIDRAIQRAGYSDGDARHALGLVNNPAYQTWFDHFIGATVNAAYPAVGGTGTPARAIVSAANASQMKLTTTTTSGDSATQALALIYRGSNYAYAATKLQIDVITTLKFEFGFADALTGAGGMVNVKATPTANGTNFAVFCFDTNHNTNLDAFACTAGTITNVGTSATALVAATDVTLEVVVENGTSQFFVNGQHVGGGAGPVSTAALTPWFAVVTRSAAAKNLSAEWVYVTGPHM